MKLLSKICLGIVALMAIAPLTHTAQQDAKSATEALATDLDKIAREVGLGGGAERQAYK